MLTGKRKNRKPSEDDQQLFYSDLISNPAMFTNVYSEKLAPQFQSIFSELDESYAKNPPPNLGSQLALKPNDGLSFQPIIDLSNNLQSQQSLANNPNNNLNSPNNQPTNQQSTANIQNNIQAMIQNDKLAATTSMKDNNALSSNIMSNINSFFGGHQPNKNEMNPYLLMANAQQSTRNKLSDTSLTASASSSPFSKQHFTSLGSLGTSLTTNLLNLKNKFSQQKNQNYFKTYKNTLSQLNGGGGAMLTAANQYNYLQQRPKQPQMFQQQQSFNRYQMISSPSKKKCVRPCVNGRKGNNVPKPFNGYSGNFNNNNNQQTPFNKGQDYESNLITNNVRQKQFYSMMQERQRPVGEYNSGDAFSNQQSKSNNFYKPIVDDKGTQIKVGSDIITIDDIEQALRRNNLHQITNKDAQVYAQLHNMLMHSINVNGEVNVMDNRSPRMISKGKIFDDGYTQQQQQTGDGATKEWRPKITQQPVQQQQEEIKQVKDTDLAVFDEPQIKETDQQQKIGEDDEDLTQQKEQQTPTTTTSSQWLPVKKPTKSGGTKSPVKQSKGGVKSPPTKSPTKGTRSSQSKLAKLQLSSDSNNSTDSSDSTDNSTSTTDGNTFANSTTSLGDDSKREVEDVGASRSANVTGTTTFTGQNGRIIKKIKRRKKKSRTDKSDTSLLTAVRSRSSKNGQAAKLIANSFEDQVKTDVSSETESTTAQSTLGQLIDTTTNSNTEIQFDDSTATSDEATDSKSKITSTTVNLPTRQEQVKGRMLAKKRKVMESTTTESSVETSPDASRDLEDADRDSDNNNNNNLQDTYFNDNITDANTDDSADSVRSGRLRLKSAVRKTKSQQLKSTDRNRPAHTSTYINSAFGDFTATFSADDSDETTDTFNSGGGKRKKKNKAIEPDESMENMHFRIDDVDADDYDALHSSNRDNDKENDGFSSGFSNENTEASETRNQLNKLPASAQINQTLFNSLLKNSKLTNNTNLTNLQPIPHLVVMSMNAGGSNADAADEESLDAMDVNSTIADLVQKIHQANGGDLNVINDYRNYFTEEEFDLLTDLLKREATRNTTTGSFTLSRPTNSTSINKKDQVSTSESQRKEHLHQVYYTHFNEQDAVKKFNNSPIYLNTNGQASLKEFYLNKANIKPEGLDVLINIQEKRPPVIGRPGTDYPVISNVTKKSSFSCLNRQPGFYADYESGCIRYFQCSSNVMNTQQIFWCANGTLFDQINKGKN